MFRLLLRTLRRQGIAPAMSATERTALAAGDVWLDGDLFSGRPDLRRMQGEPYPELTERERAFLDGPVVEVCRALDPDQLGRTKEIPQPVWALLRRHRFFGLGIPTDFGGHGFSALAQSAIFGKLASRSPSLSSVVLIPNSVGPAELLLEVGTEDQKRHYLPRLVTGEEIPCFALTEPEAGSDAASIRSRGEVFRGDDGAPYLRLDWDKRYITLAPIATLLGLAFRLEDPKNLLGKGCDVGLTCALVPTDLPGVDIGRRHDPLGLPFPNGPTRGRGVVVPASQILGGVEQAGHGWQMLMDALSGGRAISLPAQATVGVKHAARVAGGYAAVRRQFGLPVGRFQGVEEPLARLGGLAYLMEAMRVFTCGAVDRGHRPAVISAICKYNATEICRRATLDAMDVLGGAAICRGPRNLMSESYAAAPIGITVEGANILTRTLIVFGQGALRCHPHAHDLLEAIRNDDLPRFRRALLGQITHAVGSLARTVIHGLTRGRLVRTPVGSATARYHRRLVWASARLALWSDLAMAVYGGGLKLRGKLTGRFADALSWCYLTFAALRRFEAEGRRQEDLPLVRWAAEHGLSQIQEAFEGIFANFEAPLIGPLVRGPILWWARLNPLGKGPSDRLGGQVAQLLQRPGDQRDRLTSGLFIEEGSALGTLERALRLTAETAPLEAEVLRAMGDGRLPRRPVDGILDEAEAAGILDAEGRRALERAAAARREAVRVDDFSLERLRGEGGPEPKQAPDSSNITDAAAGG